MEDITSWGYSHHTETVLTIEELRDQLNCCFTCGVSWADSHVSLDCSECGGYAMNRPCPKCEGACGAIWKRDLSMVSSVARLKRHDDCVLATYPRHMCNQPETDKEICLTWKLFGTRLMLRQFSSVLRSRYFCVFLLINCCYVKY